MAPLVRTNAWGSPTAGQTLAWYARAVAAMQAKPSNDVTSWSYQAAIHGTYAKPVQSGWNECRHGSWYFVSWHRTYLYYFEEIVRAQVIALGGPSDWAIPYWDYGATGENALPLQFRTPAQPDGSPNPLYVAGRTLTGSAGLPPAATTSAFALSRTLFTGATEFGGGQAKPSSHFYSATGRLEQTPHNDVHNLVGGLMSDPSRAAEDPIFWLHHSNIDRLWWLWQKSHSDTTDPAWLQQSFSFFDTNGNSVSLTAAQIQDTAAQLGYTYDTPAAGVAPLAAGPRVARWPAPWPAAAPVARAEAAAGDDPEERREMIGGTSEPIRLVGDTVRVGVPVDTGTLASLADESAPEERQQRAYLHIEDVDAERNPGTVYGVYVNLPEDAPQSVLDAHHVGNVSLFGIERAREPASDEHPHALRFAMEITHVLDRLAAAGEWTDGTQVHVTFRPLDLVATEPDAMFAEASAVQAHAGNPVRIGRISVHYE